MAQSLRVLLVEDNPHDAELIVRSLRRAGFDTAWVRVETEPRFVEELRGEFDLVISDFALPQFNGLRALELLTQSGRDFPFILVSATIGEETAVDAMRRGAADYLMKDRLERLGQAVLHALDQHRLRQEGRQANQALRESEERFRRLIENATDVIAVVDRAGLVEYQSPSAERILGYTAEAVIGHGILEFVHPDDHAKVGRGMARALAGTLPAESVEYRIKHRDGSWRIFQSMGKAMSEPDGRTLIVVNSRDVTATRELESQFLRAQRLEAIGTLSSGIAHDLNNILAPMLMATGLLRTDIQDQRGRELLAMIENGAQRGASIIRQLLTFSRGIEGERVSVQWRHLIKEMAEIARETFPRNITVNENVARDLRSVSADATQLHQVLMNLCVNARDAMPDGGQLDLAAQNVELMAGKLPAHPDAKPGPHVLVTVADTGGGIPPEVIEKIFDPFFTTKGLGKGTGLGLSTVLGIVKSHGGFITVQSAVGQGTTFMVYLPVESGTVAAAVPNGESSPQRGHRELILFIDDEDAIRRATTSALEKWNYRVLAAADGESGLALFREHRADVKLVVTDLMMPGMGGQALIAALRALDPNMKIIAATGLEPGEKRTDLRAVGVNEILLKPYTSKILLDAIGGALAGTRQSG